MKYIPLQGQPCKLYEIHTLTSLGKTFPDRDPVNYNEIHTLTGTTL